MQKYRYTAVDMDKKKFKGHFLAEDMEDLRIQLSRQNLYLVRAVPASDRPPSAFFSISGKVKAGELTTFCRQFAIMMDSGVSIVDGLSILKEQAFSDFLRRALAHVYEDVKVGLLLSEAMEKHPKVFPILFASMAYVGEQSGTLDKVLCACADFYERDAKLRQTAKNAMIYPLFLLGMLIGILGLMIAFVIPSFQVALAQIDIPLPPLTQAVMDISHWFSQYWMYAFLGLALLVGALVGIGQLPKGTYFYHSLLLRLPIVGRVQTALISAHFARGFGLLLSGGMDVIEAMHRITKVLNNQNVQRRFALATTQVSQGKRLSAALAAQGIFPPMLIQMISVGEQTCSLDSVLLRASGYFDEQAQRALAAMTALIQPTLLVIMGITVGVLFYAIYSPMLSVMQTI